MSHRRHGAIAAFGGTLAALALLAPQAGSGSTPVDCREVTCTAEVVVGERVVKWASPEVFYPNNEQVFADLSTDRGPLALIRSYGAKKCKHRFFGSGVSALVKGCGDYTALRVRAVRLKSGTLPLRVTYSASAAMDGAPAVPGQGASLTSPQLKPISKSIGS